jgi:hypothetical protein
MSYVEISGKLYYGKRPRCCGLCSSVLLFLEQLGVEVSKSLEEFSDPLSDVF